MEEGNGDVDCLTSKLDQWKGLVPELELTADEEEAALVSNTTLVGKVISDQMVKLGVVRLVLQWAWWNVEGFKVEAIAANSFLFVFKSSQDQDRVWECRPWTVNGAHLVLK